MHDKHTHPFNGPFPGTARVSRYQKGKTNLDFTEDWLFLPTYKYAKKCPLFQLRQYGNPICPHGDTFTLEVPRWLYDYFSLGVFIIH